MPTSPDQSDFLKGFIDSLGTSKPEYLFYLTKALGYSPTCECEGCGGEGTNVNGYAAACQHGYIKYPFASASLEALKPAVDALWDEDSLVINVFGIAPHFDLEGVLIRIYAYLLGDGLNDRVPAELLPEYVVTYSSGDPLISDNIYTRTGVAYVPGIGIGTIPHNKQYVDFTWDTGFLGRSTTNGFTGSIVVPEEILNIPREHSINKLSICAAVIYPERVMYESTSNNLATRAMPLCGSLVIDIPEKPIVIPTPTISCEGATTSAGFSNGFSGPDYECYLNGVYYGLNRNPFNSYDSSELENIVSVNFDGFYYITNLVAQEQRIKFVCVEDVWNVPTIDSDNPTIHIDEATKTITFCLAPAGNTP